MGLLDEIGKMLGKGSQEDSGNLSAIALLQQLFSDNGGIDGFLQMFRDKGLGGVVASWIQNGQNLPISPEQIQDVLGNEHIAKIAGKLGIDPQQASAQIAQLLPGLIDRLSPNGDLPAERGDLISMGSSLLKDYLKNR